MIILERLYFDPETESFYNEEEVESLYSEKNSSRDLNDPMVRSNRGYGRGILLGGAAGALGTHAGKEKAIKLARQGADDDEIMEKSTKHGRRVGAGVGAGLGALSGLAGTAASIHAKNKLANFNLFGEKITIPGAKKIKGKKAAALMAAGALGNAALGAGIGALGGHFGTKKNVQTRLDKDRDLRLRGGSTK